MVPPSLCGKVFGFNNLITTLSAVPAPWLADILRDSTGSFALPIYIGAIMAVAGGLLAYTTPRFKLRVNSYPKGGQS